MWEFNITESSWASSHAQYPSILSFACKPHAPPSATLDSPFLFPATAQLPYPSPDLLASSAEYHAGCPSPSTSSPSQPRVLLLLSRVAHHAAYHSSTWDQLKTSQGSLSAVRNLGQQKTHSRVQAVGGFAEQLASSSATAEALQHGMHQVTEQIANTHASYETMNGQVADLRMQLGKEQSARQAAEMQLTALQA